MDPWTQHLLRMLAAPVCVAAAGLLSALLLHRLAVWSESAVLLQWAGPLFQASLGVALAMSALGYGRLRRRRSAAERAAWHLLPAAGK